MPRENKRKRIRTYKSSHKKLFQLAKQNVNWQRERAPKSSVGSGTRKLLSNNLVVVRKVLVVETHELTKM